MATFKMTEEDLEGFIQRDQRQLLKEQTPWVATALGTALLLAWIQPLLASVALGMGVAWTYSLVKQLRMIRPWYMADNEVNIGPVTMEIRDDGVWTNWALGEGITRWTGLDAVKNYPDFFVLEATGQEILVMPKRYFSENELILLQSKAMEVNENGGKQETDNNSAQ